MSNQSTAFAAAFVSPAAHDKPHPVPVADELGQKYDTTVKTRRSEMKKTAAPARQANIHKEK